MEFAKQSSNEAGHRVGRRCLNFQLFGNWVYDNMFPFLLEELEITMCNQCPIW